MKTDHDRASNLFRPGLLVLCSAVALATLRIRGTPSRSYRMKRRVDVNSGAHLYKTIGTCTHTIYNHTYVHPCSHTRNYSRTNAHIHSYARMLTLRYKDRTNKGKTHTENTNRRLKLGSGILESRPATTMAGLTWYRSNKRTSHH